MTPNITLRRARERRGWSQAHVARELGTDARNVSRWERGNTSPSPYFRERLCQLFQLDAEALSLLMLTPTDLSSPLAPTETGKGPLLDPAQPPLTLPPTHIIGREVFLETLFSTLERGTTHTLYGLPGVGKTTLAQLVRRDPRCHVLFPDGLLWISLGPTPNIQSELLRLATVLQAPENERAKVRSTEALSAYVHDLLGARRLLIVIDDVWSLEALFPMLVGGAHAAHIVTTRLPDVAFALPTSTPLLVPELDTKQSYTLLTTLVPQLTEETTDSVQVLIHAMGGLPLTLTLMGHYLRTQSIGGQKRRMQVALTHLSHPSSRFQLAVPQPPSRRSLSLTSVIRLSDEQVSAEAQQALRALSVLPSKPESFSEEAALAVCAQGVEVLDQLLDVGLLEGAGEGRYRMHQTISEYGALHRQDQRPLRRLVDYALHHCQEHEYELSHLAREHASLCAALAITSHQGWFSERLQLLKRLRRLWFVQYRYEVLEKEYTQALEVASRQNHIPGRLMLLHDLGRLDMARGMLHEAEALISQGLLLARQHPEYLEEYLGFLNGYGLVNYVLGRGEQAAQALQEGLALAQRVESDEDICVFLNGLGQLAQQQGHFRQAMHVYQQSLVGARCLQRKRGICLVLQNVGECAVAVGQWDEAEQYYQEALALAHMEGFEEYYCRSFYLSGILAQSRGEQDQAQLLLEQGQLQAQRVGDRALEVDILHQLILLTVHSGALTRAEHLLKQAAIIVQTMEEVPIKGKHAYVQGELLLAQQQVEQAEQAFEQALPLLEREEAWSAEAAYGMARAKAAQGKEVKARHWGEQSLAQFTAMEHWRVAGVNQWLTTLSPHHAPVLATSVGQEQPQHCPLCDHKGKLYKKGKTRKGTQRYQCRVCGGSFSQHSFWQEKDQTKQICAWELAHMGLSRRAIARELGVHHKTVSSWLALTQEPLMGLPQEIPPSNSSPR